MYYPSSCPSSILSLFEFRKSQLKLKESLGDFVCVSKINLHWTSAGNFVLSSFLALVSFWHLCSLVLLILFSVCFLGFSAKFSEIIFHM